MSGAFPQQQEHQSGTHRRNRSYRALPNVLLGNIPGSASATAKHHTASFQPGPIGMRADWTAGRITAVVADGQAQRAGVEVGMVIFQVDGQGYSEKVLDMCRTRQRPYILTFQTQETGCQNIQNIVMAKPSIEAVRRQMPGESTSAAYGHIPSASTAIDSMQGPLAPGSGLKLLACVGLDLCGNASYLLPEIGEATDIVWAPMQAIALKAMFHSNMVPLVGLFEELIPGTDIIPTATIAWCLEAYGYLQPLQPASSANHTTQHGIHAPAH